MNIINNLKEFIDEYNNTMFTYEGETLFWFNGDNFFYSSDLIEYPVYRSYNEDYFRFYDYIEEIFEKRFNIKIERVSIF